MGSLPIGLVDNYSSIYAGTEDTRIIIPTIPIMPAGLADNKIDNLDYTNIDQRDFDRSIPTDIGAIQSSWIKYDSNGGNFSLGSLPDIYDGETYYDNVNGTNYYQVGYNGIATNIPTGEKMLGIHRDGYTFKGWSLDADATEPDLDYKENNEIAFINTNITLYAIWIEDQAAANVTVEYIDQDGTKLADNKELSGNLGADYTSEALIIDGYTLVATPTNAKGTFTDQAQTVTYVYMKDPTSAADVTVRYVDQDGNALTGTLTLSGNLGDSYTSEALTIAGYSLVEIPSNASGVFTEQTQTVTYVYKEIDKPVVPDKPINHDKPVDSNNKNLNSSTYKNELPQTSGSNNIFSILIGIIVSLLSILVIPFKKKNN